MLESCLQCKDKIPLEKNILQLRKLNDLWVPYKFKIWNLVKKM